MHNQTRLHRRVMIQGLAGIAGSAILAACGGADVATSTTSPVSVAPTARVNTPSAAATISMTANSTAQGATSSQPATTQAAMQNTAPASSTIDLLESGDSAVAGPLQQLSDSGLFQKAGVKVNLINPGGSDEQVDERLKANRVAGQLPDLAVVSSASARIYVDANLTQPLEGIISSDTAFNGADLNPGLLATGKLKGHQYAMPFLAGFLVMYYNPDAFQKAGLDANKPPQTFTELGNQAQQIVAKNAARYGAVFAYDSDNMWPVQNFLASAGGSWTNADETKITFTTPQLQSIMTFFSGLAKQHATAALTRQEAREAFYRGDLAMLVDSSSTLGTAKKTAKFDVRFTSYPIPDGGSRKTVPSSETLVMFTKDPMRQAAAWQAIKQVISQDGSAKIIEAGAGGLLAMSNAANNAAAFMYPVLKTGLNDTSSAGGPWYQFPGSHGTEIWNILRNQVVAVLQGNKEPTDALKAAETDAQPLLAS